MSANLKCSALQTLYVAGVDVSEMAAFFGCTHQNIHNIKNPLTGWKAAKLWDNPNYRKILQDAGLDLVDIIRHPEKG